MDVATEVEDEVIWYIVSQKLDRLIVNPPNKVWRDLTQFKNTPSPVQIDDYLRYTN